MALPVLIQAAMQYPQQAVVLPSPEQSWVTIISQVGFPIAVSIYLLWMLDKRLNRISFTLERLSELQRLRPTESEDDK